jgi:hypothetical protein
MKGVEYFTDLARVMATSLKGRHDCSASHPLNAVFHRGCRGDQKRSRWNAARAELLKNGDLAVRTDAGFGADRPRFAGGGDGVVAPHRTSVTFVPDCDRLFTVRRYAAMGSDVSNVIWFAAEVDDAVMI